MHQAARLHKVFVQVLTINLVSVADQRMVVVTPREKANRFSSQISPQWSVAHQSDGDLGQRMMSWFSDVIHESTDEVQQSAILIGADCPMINDEVIESAAEQLKANDVVIGPAVDGGYYLLGLSGPWRPAYQRLFVSMPWSSDEVLSETIQRCDEAGLAVAMLPTREDIDTIESLDRLRAELLADTTTECASSLLQQIDTILTQESQS